MNTHMSAQKYTRNYVRACSNKSLHTHVYTLTLTYTHTHTYTHSDSYIHALTLIDTRTHTHTYTQSHSPYMHTHSHVHIHAFMHTRTYSQTHWDTHTHTLIYICIHMHVHEEFKTVICLCWWYYAVKSTSERTQSNFVHIFYVLTTDFLFILFIYCYFLCIKLIIKFPFWPMCLDLNRTTTLPQILRNYLVIKRISETWRSNP